VQQSNHIARCASQLGRRAAKARTGDILSGQSTRDKAVRAAVSAALLLALLSSLLGVPIIRAQTEVATDSAPLASSADTPQTSESTASAEAPPAVPQVAEQATGNGWLSSWLNRVAEARASQPHTAAPLVTTHNQLVQQFRYDGYVQQDPNSTWTTNAGSGRGLEIIPTTRLEVAFAMPPYLTHQSSVPDGMGDWSFLVKFRAFSAPEGQGDYFVGFVLSTTLATGNKANSSGHAVWNPAVAFGKGWGNFNLQNTFGGTLPQTGANILGRTTVLNDVAQYRLKRVIWPMVEVNSTFWSGGHNDGKKQVFLTPGIVFGSFSLTPRLRIAVGAGEQIAITEFHTYNHRYILSLRLPFG
jgi:hypothetical protein